MRIFYIIVLGDKSPCDCGENCGTALKCRCGRIFCNSCFSADIEGDGNTISCPKCGKMYGASFLNALITVNQWRIELA